MEWQAYQDRLVNHSWLAALSSRCAGKLLHRILDLYTDSRKPNYEAKVEGTIHVLSAAWKVPGKVHCRSCEDPK